MNTPSARTKIEVPLPMRCGAIGEFIHARDRDRVADRGVCRSLGILGSPKMTSARSEMLV
jgi:hypothetical protein